MGVVAAFLILGYYGVVAGWTLEYMVASATGRLSGSKDYTLFSSMTLSAVLGNLYSIWRLLSC